MKLLEVSKAAVLGSSFIVWSEKADELSSSLLIKLTSDEGYTEDISDANSRLYMVAQ